MSNDQLEDALDGLMDAVDYCEENDLAELSRSASDLYQEIAIASPEEHWDDAAGKTIELENGSTIEVEQDADVCPVCEEMYNHRVENGFRNYWPRDVKFEVCTTTDSDTMYVHTQDLRYSGVGDE